MNRNTGTEMVAETGEWVDDTALLLLTYSGIERYVPDVMQNLDLFWPGRPQTFVVTDGDLDGDDVIRLPGASFAELLANAVKEVRVRRPDVSKVFLLLEDLCPLAPVDEGKLSTALGMFRRFGLSYLAFQWNTSKRVQWKNGEWDVSDALREGSVDLVPLKRGWGFYNSLVASVWQIDYLEKVAEAQIAQGRHDPWSFEAPLEGEQPQHYLLDGSWPTVGNGFTYQRSINPKATWRFASRSPLLTRLRREYCGFDSRILARLKHAVSEMNNTAGRRPQPAPGTVI